MDVSTHNMEKMFSDMNRDLIRLPVGNTAAIVKCTMLRFVSILSIDAEEQHQLQLHNK